MRIDIDRNTNLYKLTNHAINRALGIDANIVDVVVEYLECNGVFFPKCKIGDSVYYVFESEDDLGKVRIIKDVVTEVGKRGFWVSGCLNPKGTEMNLFYEWDSESISTELFFDEKDAIAAADSLKNRQ